MRSRRIVFVLLLLFAVSSSGCAALVVGAAAGGGTAVYIKGQVEQTFSHSVPRVHEATLAALKELNMPVIEDNHDDTSAKMKSVVASGEDVWINISALSNTASKVTVRVGTMGDEGKSTAIINKIEKNL